MTGEAGFAARAERHRFEAFVDQIAVVKLLDDPPDGFNVVIGQRDIGIVEIKPEPDPACDFVP